MRKFVLVLVSLVILVGGGLYFVSGLVLSIATDKVFETLLSHGQTDNFSVLKPHYRGVHLSGLDGIIWKGISFKVMVTDPKNRKQQNPYWVWFETVTLKAVNFAEGVFVVSGTGIRAEGEGSGQPATSEKQFGYLKDATFTVMFHLDIFSPSQAVKQLTKVAVDLKQLIQKGNTSIPVQFDGTIILPVNNQEVPARMQIIQQAKQYVLILNKQSLRDLSTALDEKLTEPEIELFSGNPLKTPKLFNIKDDAKKTAQNARKADRTVPEDAYRHVLWSYLLSKAYGPDFAQRVTDAHELGLTDNAEADHRMDYNNNKVGRNYARLDYARDAILKRLLNDPQVILAP